MYPIAYVGYLIDPLLRCKGALDLLPLTTVVREAHARGCCLFDKTAPKKRQRDKETKRPRDKETKRQRYKETKGQRDKETKGQRG